MTESTQPADMSKSAHAVDTSDIVERLRGRVIATRWARGLDLDYATAWEPDSLCREAADEIVRLRAAADRARELEADARRLDYILRRQAFIVWCNRDGSIKQCQLMEQNEDEEYIVLSGEDRFFNTERAALDAAIDRAQGEQA